MPVGTLTSMLWWLMVSFWIADISMWDLRPLRELFRAHVLKMLKKEGLIDDTFIQMILRWRHTSGFNVHNEVRIKPEDEKGIENLSQYIIRNTFSLEKLKYDEGDSSVIYRSKMTHGKNKRNFQVFSPLEFVAAITQHIPEPSFQLVRYYGWYSNRMRGDRKRGERGRGKNVQVITVLSIFETISQSVSRN